MRFLIILLMLCTGVKAGFILPTQVVGRPKNFLGTKYDYKKLIMGYFSFAKMHNLQIQPIFDQFCRTSGYPKTTQQLLNWFEFIRETINASVLKTVNADMVPGKMYVVLKVSNVNPTNARELMKKKNWFSADTYARENNMKTQWIKVGEKYYRFLFNDNRIWSNQVHGDTRYIFINVETANENPQIEALKYAMFVNIAQIYCLSALE